MYNMLCCQDFIFDLKFLDSKAVKILLEKTFRTELVIPALGIDDGEELVEAASSTKLPAWSV